MPDRMPERMSEYMPESMSEQVPNSMSNRMPKYMPERMSDIVKQSVRINMPYIYIYIHFQMVYQKLCHNSGSGWGSHSKKVIRIGKPWVNNYD